MNKKNYRLVGVSENFDKITKTDIILFTLAPVDYKDNGYFFNPQSDENLIFIYAFSDEIENHYMSQKDQIISIDLDNFELFLDKSDNDIAKTYIEKRYASKRINSTFWQNDAYQNIVEGKQIAFKFTHYEESTFTYSNDYNEFNNEVIPSNYSNIEFKIENNFLVIDKDTVTFCFQNNNGIFTRIKGTIQKIHIDDHNRIKKIETLSHWALTDNEIINYEFDTFPSKFLQKSERNVVVTLRGRQNQPSIRAQWSLMFGESLGIVNFQ